MQTHGDSHSHLTLTLDLFTSGSMHVEGQPRTIYLPTVVLIAQAVFFLVCEQTDTQTRLITIPTRPPPTCVMNHNWQSYQHYIHNMGFPHPKIPTLFQNMLKFSWKQQLATKKHRNKHKCKQSASSCKIMAKYTAYLILQLFFYYKCYNYFKLHYNVNH